MYMKLIMISKIKKFTNISYLKNHHFSIFCMYFLHILEYIICKVINPSMFNFFPRYYIYIIVQIDKTYIYNI